MKILTVAGSLRQQSTTQKIIQIINDYLSDKVDVELINLNREKLVFPGQGEPSSKLINKVKNIDALIFATPEYHGSYSAIMKLFIENLQYPSILKGKPVALIGVAAGVLGATKSLEHLRSVCNHMGMIILPKAVSIASVYQVFDKQGQLTDVDLLNRLQNLADDLIDFTQKLF